MKHFLEPIQVLSRSIVRALCSSCRFAKLGVVPPKHAGPALHKAAQQRLARAFPSAGQVSIHESAEGTVNFQARLLLPESPAV